MRIHGLTASEQLNDVQIKATWRSADGAQECSDMLELTVISIVLRFDTIGVWAGADPDDLVEDGINNINIQGFVRAGAPFLGEISPGVPSASWFFGESEQVCAALTPCVAGIVSEFDFKRNAIGPTLLGNTSLQIAVADPNTSCPTWCDDDLVNGMVDNSDEDLAIDPPPACTLFSIDIPGFQNPNGQTEETTCASSVATAETFLLNAKNMREWVNIDRYRGSATLEWYARIEIGCVMDPITGATTWAHTNRFIQAPKLGVGNPPLPTLGFGGFVRQPSEVTPIGFSIRNALNAMRAKDPATRLRGVSALSRMIPQHRLEPLARERIVRGLLDMLHERAVAEQEAPYFCNTSSFAIAFLGDLDAFEAIPFLLDNITDPHWPAVGHLPPRGDSVRALVMIGNSTVAPILERCGSEPDERWRLMTGVLRQIDKDSPLVRQTMRTVLDAQSWFEEVEAAGGVPQPDEAEKARRALVKQRLTEFLSTPEP
ncbi:MAG: hypothetical protein D6692_02575, partial [Planctomycetota bacterium]